MIPNRPLSPVAPADTGRATARRGSPIPWPRHQPPAYSPIGIRAIARACAAAVGVGKDPREAAQASLRRSYEADDAILCGSGTQALLLALRLGLRPGVARIVALPAYTCFDVASAAVAAGCRIVLYDIDPVTLTADLDSLRAALRDGARLVVVAPSYGVPPDWESIDRCVTEHGAIPIEDAAQGHGGRWHDRPLGSLAPFSVVSFGRGKGWTAGRGGALLLRGDIEALPLQRPFRAHAGAGAELSVLIGATAQELLGGPSLYGLPAGIPWLGLGETRYRGAAEPAVMPRSAAALLLGSREAAEEEADFRRRRGAYWHAAVGTRAGVGAVALRPGATPGYLRFPLRLARGLAGFPDPRAALRLGLAPGYPTPLSSLAPVRRLLAGQSRTWPGAEEIARTLVTLPTHSGLRPWERDRILALLEGYQA